MKSVVIVSPVMSHGFGQGNSTRIISFSRIFAQAEFSCFYFHVETEGVTPASAVEQMRKSWDVYVPTSWWPDAVREARSGPFSIDDWVDDQSLAAFERVLERYDFDVVVINYVWMSKFAKLAKQLQPNATVVLDTHDRFGDRDILSLRSGLKPSWFFTTVDEEAKGLARADIVVAIQPAEAEYFSGICSSEVFCVRHLQDVVAPGNFQRQTGLDRVLRVGYVGSQNVWNVQSLSAFVREADARFGHAWPFVLVLAGPISTIAEFNKPHITRLGFLDDVSQFYCDIDVAINPMIGGTGLKIKTIEALAHGRPIVSTKDGSFGLGSGSPFLNCTTVHEVVEYLGVISTNLKIFEKLGLDCRVAFDDYQTGVSQEQDKFLDRVRS